MKEQTTIRLTREVYNELSIISKNMGLTVTALMIVAIWWNVLRLRKQQL